MCPAPAYAFACVAYTDTPYAVYRRSGLQHETEAAVCMHHVIVHTEITIVHAHFPLQSSPCQNINVHGPKQHAAMQVQSDGGCGV